MSKLHDKVKAALETDNSIVVSREELGKHPGFTQKYMEELGLSKVDLKKLERKGLAVRGYTKNTWNPGETMPNQRVVEQGAQYFGRGHRPMWVLIANEGLEFKNEVKV